MAEQVKGISAPMLHPHSMMRAPSQKTMFQCRSSLQLECISRGKKELYCLYTYILLPGEAKSPVESKISNPPPDLSVVLSSLSNYYVQLAKKNIRIQIP